MIKSFYHNLLKSVITIISSVQDQWRYCKLNKALDHICTLAHPWDWILITLGDLWIMENNFWRPITQEKFEFLDTLALNPITPSRNITPEEKHAYLTNIFFKYTINVLILRSFYLGWWQLLLLKHTYPHWGYLRWCQIVDSKSTYPHWG